MTPLFVTWNFNPVMVAIGSFEIRWYGLMWALAFGAGLWLFDRFIKREGLSPKLLDSIFWFGALATIIGARLGHCFFYEPKYYLARPWEVFYIRDGGLASHGAAIGLLLGLWLFSRRNKIPYLWSLDRIMVPVTVGGAMVRLGNLFNSEIYGTPTDLPWGFIFVRAGETVPKHPTQIYEALCYLTGFIILLWLYYKRDMGRRHPGFLFGVGLIVVFLSRFIIETIKNPQETFEQGMALNMGQLLSLPFIVAGIILIVYSLRHKAVVAPQPAAKSEKPAPKTKK